MRKKIVHIVIGALFPGLLCSQEVQDIYLKGRVMIQKEEYASAVQLFSQLLENDKYNTDYYLMRGTALYKQEKYYPALNDFHEANKIKRNIADLQLAKCYARLGDEDKMFEALGAHLESRYKRSESEIKFDPAFKAYQETPRWVEFWKNSWYSKRDYTIAEVGFLIKYERYQQALDRINDELKGRSRNHELYAARASVYQALLNYPKAETDFSKAIQLNGRVARYYVGRAKTYMQLGKYKNAIADLNEAIEMEPHKLDLLALRSMAHQKGGNFGEAEADIKTYLSYFPDNEDALFQCGNMYYDFEKYLDALPYFNQCLEKNTSKPEYFEARGNAYYQVKTYKYAIRDFSMALDLDPTSADAYLYKGLSRKAMGDAKGACSDWEKAQRLGSRKAKELLINNCQ